MDGHNAHPTTALVPEGATSLRVTGWSRTDPHTDVAAAMPAADGDSVLTIHTLVRTGERFSASGFAHGVATDQRTLASSAVWSFLASRLPPIESDAERAVARAAVQEVEAIAEEAAARLQDPTRWSLRSVMVDGEEFVLHVHAFPDGFAAFADLGPEVVTMGGRTLPDPLVLVRRPAIGDRLG